MGGLRDEVLARIERLELPFSRGGFDPYGISKHTLAWQYQLVGAFYRHYFSVRLFGVEHVPSRGRAMLVPNHCGGIALDAALIFAACFFELEPPRLAQGMADRFLGRLPFISMLAARMGHITGLPEHAARLLSDERLLMVFPEGVSGTRKLYRERYELRPFGTGFMRLALETDCPIIPIAFLGGGEAVPTILNLEKLGRLIGTPYVPITPYLLPIPRPVRIEIHFGKPLRFHGTGHEGDTAVADFVETVRSRISELLGAARPGYGAR